MLTVLGRQKSCITTHLVLNQRNVVLTVSYHISKTVLFESSMFPLFPWQKINKNQTDTCEEVEPEGQIIIIIF